MTFDRADMRILNKHNFQPFFNEMAKEQSPLSFFNLPKAVALGAEKSYLTRYIHLGFHFTKVN